MFVSFTLICGTLRCLTLSNLLCNSRLCAKYKCLVFANLLFISVLVKRCVNVFVARHFHFNSSFVRSFVLCIHVQMQENVFFVVVVVVIVVELVKSFFSCYYCCFQWTTISCYKQWIRLRMFVDSTHTERLKRWRKEK